MKLRTVVVLAVVLSVLTACSGDDDVPPDQALLPADTPSGWETTDLDALTVSTPPAWTKGQTEQTTKTVATTTWRAQSVGGTSPAGLEVRVISRPQQPADKAARSLAVNAMATLQGGEVDPQEITWPEAEVAFLLAYDATFGTPGEKSVFVTRTMVLDLADGRQVQVTSIAQEDGDVKLPEQVLATVTLPPDDA